MGNTKFKTMKISLNLHLQIIQNLQIWLKNMTDTKIPENLTHIIALGPKLSLPSFYLHICSEKKKKKKVG